MQRFDETHTHTHKPRNPPKVGGNRARPGSSIIDHRPLTQVPAQRCNIAGCACVGAHELIQELSVVGSSEYHRHINAKYGLQGINRMLRDMPNSTSR